jgi:hypothetical protein
VRTRLHAHCMAMYVCGCELTRQRLSFKLGRDALLRAEVKEAGEDASARQVAWLCDVRCIRIALCCNSSRNETHLYCRLGLNITRAIPQH